MGHFSATAKTSNMCHGFVPLTEALFYVGRQRVFLNHFNSHLNAEPSPLQAHLMLFGPDTLAL